MTGKIKRYRLLSWLLLPALLWPPCALAEESWVPEGCDKAVATGDMRDCLDAGLKKANDQLRTLNRQLDRALSKPERDKLHKAQMSWRGYVYDTCRSESFLYNGGTMEIVIYRWCELELTVQNIERMREAYKQRLHAAGVSE